MGGIQGGPAAVLWDMDGTLLDSEKLWDVALHTLAADLGGRLSREAREAMIGSDMSSSMVILLDDIGLPATDSAVESALGRLRVAMATLFRSRARWRPGARELLSSLADSRMPMALVTNTERALADHALPTLGRRRFAAVVCGDEVVAGKPAPYPYLRAAELLGIDPGDCLAIEDSPTGAAAAVAAGCPVLVVPCEVEVPLGPGRIFRDSLGGLAESDLRDVWRLAREAGPDAVVDGSTGTLAAFV